MTNKQLRPAISDPLRVADAASLVPIRGAKKMGAATNGLLTYWNRSIGGDKNFPARFSAMSAEPHGFTHLPLAFDDLTAASTKAIPLTPSSMVGKCVPLGGFLPERAATIARATSA